MTDINHPLTYMALPQGKIVKSEQIGIEERKANIYGLDDNYFIALIQQNV